jgi:8-oxo-(d)GTP phosphatase
MNIFIHQTHLQLVIPQELHPKPETDCYFDLSQRAFDYNYMSGKVCIRNATLKQLQEFITWAIADKIPETSLVQFGFDDLIAVKDAIKKSFRVIQAGGGLVRKDDKLLMIHRLGRWDLPKGKMDPNEKFKQTAQREVEEECNIKVKVDKKLCTTWHFYPTEKYQNLKQTRWYSMDCLDDSKMKPQIEEDIHDIKWMNPDEWQNALKTSYTAIQYVFRTYQHLFVGDEMKN